MRRARVKKRHYVWTVHGGDGTVLCVESLSTLCYGGYNSVHCSPLSVSSAVSTSEPPCASGRMFARVEINGTFLLNDGSY